MCFEAVSKVGWRWSGEGFGRVTVACCCGEGGRKGGKRGECVGEVQFEILFVPQANLSDVTIKR